MAIFTRWILAPFATVLYTWCAPPGLSLADAVRQAQTNHPQLRAAGERIGAAQGLKVQAGLTRNPRLFLQSENTRFNNLPGFVYWRDTDSFAYLSQVFETGGKRRLRTEAAGAAVDTAEAQRASLEHQIGARVSLAYWSAAAAFGLRDLLRQNVENFERVVQYHRDRVREGAMAEVDLLRVELERDRQQYAAQAADQEATRLRIALQQEMGQMEFPPVELTDRLNDVRDLTAPEITAVLAARPDIAVARRAVAETRAALRLQNAVAKPDREALFGYKRSAGFNTFIAGFQVDLPFRNRNQGAIAAASLEIRAAEALLADAERQVRAEVAIAWADYQARSRLVTETVRPMMQRAEEIARIAQAAYREGGVDLLRLLDAERARIDSLTLYYRALSEYQQSVTSLRIATGSPL